MTHRQMQYQAHRLAHLEIHGAVRAHSLDRTCGSCIQAYCGHLALLLSGQYTDADPAELIARRRQVQREQWQRRKEREARFNERMPAIPKARVELTWRSSLA